MTCAQFTRIRLLLCVYYFDDVAKVFINHNNININNITSNIVFVVNNITIT